VRRRVRKDEEGFTVLEMTVAGALLSIVLAIVGGALVSLQNTVVTASARGNAVDQAHLAVEELRSQLHSANYFYDPATYAPYASAGADPYTAGYSLVIFTQTAGIFQCRQWKVASNSLMTRTWTQGYPGDGSSPNSWTTVATDINNAAHSVVPFTLPATPAAYGLRLVQINIYVEGNPNQGSSTEPSSSYGSDVQIQDSVEGMNVEYGYPSTVCTNVPTG